MKECKHEWVPLGNDRWSCKNCAMVKVGYVEELKEENRVLKTTLEFVCDGYVRPNVYGTDIWEEAEKCGGLEQYFIQQAKEVKDE